MSKVMSVTFPDEVYERLLVSCEKMGLTKSGYITYCLKSVFNSEDVIENVPDLLKQLKDIANKLDQKEGE